MDYLLQDLRLASRRLRQSPGFAAAAILTLALGIGANTVTFSALNKLVFRPLPVEHPEQLVMLNNRHDEPSQSYPVYKELRSRATTFAGVIGYRIAPVAMTVNGANAHVWGYEVTGNYFQVLGVNAVLGRALTPADDQKTLGHPVVVLSQASWQRRFNADPSAIGRTVKINGLDYTILGVMPRNFFGIELAFSPEFFVPMAMEPQIEPGNPWLDHWNTWNTWVAGRLKPGVSRSQAEAELNTIAAQLAREHSFLEGMRFHLSAAGLMGNVLRGPVTGFATVLMGVAGLVLLIACINLASLLLARASDRQKEIAIRLALGAGKLRLVRQLLAESFLLSLTGAAAGLLLASWIVDLLAAWRPPIDIPIDTNFAIDRSVLAFTAVAGLITALLFGLAPAIQAVKADLVPALKNSSFAARFRRWPLREILVTSQIALSLVLLTGTLLVVRSLQRALTINIGYNPRNAVAVSFDLGLEGYSEDRGREFQRRIVEKIAALPGVQSAGLANALPLGLDTSTTTVYAEGKTLPKPQDTPSANYYMVDPGYFRTMQTRFLAGRDFSQRDRQGASRVAIVNHAFAARMFPQENAIGKRFHQGPQDPNWIEITGIVEDGKYVSLGDGELPVIFWPSLQQYTSTATVVARSALPPDQLVRSIEHTVRELDPGMPFYQAGSLDDHLRLPLLPARLAASMLGAFGVLALVLAATGVYGVMAYAVARRKREIGIRIAIGATRARVLRLVLRRTAVLLLVGSILGIATALVAGSLASPILYGVSPTDPTTFIAAALLMAAVSLAASFVPARRAMSIEPASALREE